MRFLEHAFAQEAAFYLIRLKLLVALDEDLLHLDFLFFVDVYIEYHLILVGHVGTLQNLYIGIFKAFVVEVAFGKRLGAVYHIRCNLVAAQQAQLFLEVILLTLLHTVVVDLRHARQLREVDVKIYFVAHDRVGHDTHV